MSLPDISIRVLTPETDLTAFKCAEGDLNEFFAPLRPTRRKSHFSGILQIMGTR